MCWVRDASKHERDMLSRTSLTLFGASPLAVVALANDRKPGDTNHEGISAFGGSWFAVSPAGAKVTPPSQPQGGGGYGG